MRSFQGGANLATGGNKMRRALRHAALLLSGWLTAGFAPSPSSSRRTVRLSSVVPQIDSRELLLALERLDNAFLTHLARWALYRKEVTRLAASAGVREGSSRRHASQWGTGHTSAGRGGW